MGLTVRHPLRGRRDAALVAGRLAGQTLEALGSEVGLTTERVRQILKGEIEARRRAGDIEAADRLDSFTHAGKRRLRPPAPARPAPPKSSIEEVRARAAPSGGPVCGGSGAVDLRRWVSSAGQAARARLGRAFRRNGYARTGRRENAGSSTHRGYELRFVAGSPEDRDDLTKWLDAAGVRPGRPFRKGGQWRIPVYGRSLVTQLLTDFAGPRVRRRK